MNAPPRIPAKQGDAEAFKALGDILDRDIGSPYDLSDEMDDALYSLALIYRAQFGTLKAIAENPDDGKPYIDPDYLRDMRENDAVEAAFDAAEAVRS